jgi:cell cycle arrest protein BUB3
LCGSFGHSSDKCYSGGVDKIARELDSMAEGAHRILGRHQAPIRACEFVKSLGALLTGSWDCTMKLLDPRAASSEITSIALVDKVFAMDVFDTKAVVALADGSLNTFDLRNLDAGAQVSRPSTIGHQIRTVRMFERGEAALVGSIEGRVAVENLDLSQPVAKRYAFKCHRVDETIYPVNAIAVRPLDGEHSSIFATGGGDGTVVLWDVMQKKRLFQCPDLNTSCSSLEFSPDGASLAIASSYCFERGEIAHHPDSLLILDVNAALASVADTSVASS